MITKENLVKYLEREFLETYKQEADRLKKRILLSTKWPETEMMQEKLLELRGGAETIIEILRDIQEGKLDNYTAEFKG